MLESVFDEGGVEEMIYYTTVMSDRFRDILGWSLQDNKDLLDEFLNHKGANSSDLQHVVRSPPTKRSEHTLKELLLSEAQGGIRKQVPYSDILLSTTDIRPLDASQHFQIGLSLAKLCMYKLSQHHITMSSTPWDPAYHKLRAALSLPPVHSSLGSLATAINNFENQIEKYILSGSLKSTAITTSCESFDESSYVLAVLPLLHLMGYSAPRREILFGHSPVAMAVLLSEFYQAMCPPPKPFIPVPQMGPGEKSDERTRPAISQQVASFGSKRKLRIGVISGSFDGHAGRIIVGLFENKLDTDSPAGGVSGRHPKSNSEYELIALCFPTPRDKITDRARLLFQEHVNLDSRNRKKTIQRISKAQLDIIIFSDGGHDSRTFALAHYRLAPYQLMYWGWGGTLGLKTVDYYLYPDILWTPKSCKLSDGRIMSPQQLYSEQVVLLEGLPPYARVKDKESPYKSGSGPEVWEKFQKFLLLPPENRSHLYLFPGSVRQFHPEMDQAVSIILKTDPLAIVIFTTPLMGRDMLPPLHESVKNDLLHPVMPVAGAAQVKERLVPYIGEEAARRLRFLPPIDDKTFYVLRSNVVAVFDSFPVGMHVPVLEAMAAGVPVVSAPKLQECTNSHAFSIAKSFSLGISEEEAGEFWPKTPEEYAVLAMRLARDRRLRQLFIPRSSLMSDHGAQVLAFSKKLLGL